MTPQPLRSNPSLAEPDCPAHRLMMVLGYDGAPFHGWQIQPGDRSVQEDVENALRIALKTPLHIVGAGRTDTEVNARMMTAHFDVTEEVFADRLATDEQRNAVLRTINALLRPSVAVWNIFEVEREAHARFDATLRTYRYYLHTVDDPFRARRSRYFYQKLDFDLMNREAAALKGTQDFTSFSKLHTDTANNICTVTAAQWHCYAPGHYYFEISANRFLRNMVRAIVGTLVDIGTGRQQPGHIERVIKAQDRCAAGASMPGYALYLWDIAYPYPIPSPPQPDTL